MACVTACPSGVQYAPLIEATRAQIERRYPRSFGDRLFRGAIFALFPYPGRLRLALAAAGRLARSCSTTRRRRQRLAEPLRARGRADEARDPTRACARRVAAPATSAACQAPGIPSSPCYDRARYERRVNETNSSPCGPRSTRRRRNRRFAPSPPRDAVARAAGDVALALRVDARAHARQRRPAADGRPADRLRAAPRLSARQRGDRQRARGRRLRRGRAAGAGLLRRAGAARGPARRGARLRAPHDRGLRARRRRAHRRQRRRLRIVDEGVRRAAGRRSARGPSARARSRRGCATSPRSSRSSARRGRRGIRSRCASRITTPVTSRTRRASASRRAICCGRFPASSSCRSPTGDLLRQRRHLQPRRARGRARARRPQGRAHRRRQPDVVATANPGCMLQISGGRRPAAADWPVRPSHRNPGRLDPRMRV